MKKSKASPFFDRSVNPATEKYVTKNLDIAVQVLDHLKDLGWTQKEFAQKMGKSEAEISKWVSGLHNLTLKSITKMEVVLGKDIIITPQKAKKQYQTIKYVTYKVYATTNKSIVRGRYSEGSKEGVVLKRAI